MWLVVALLSAFSAALVAIFGKIGLKNLDSTLATTIRSIIMALFLIIISLSLGKFKGFDLQSLSGKDWFWITMAGVAGASSWLFYFWALKLTTATKVVVIDRLSLVFVIILAGIFLSEAISWKTVLGAILMISGAIMISLT